MKTLKTIWLGLILRQSLLVLLGWALITSNSQESSGSDQRAYTVPLHPQTKNLIYIIQRLILRIKYVGETGHILRQHLT